MITVYCEICKTVANLGEYAPQLSDYFLSCGHRYYEPEVTA